MARTKRESFATPLSQTEPMDISERKKELRRHYSSKRTALDTTYVQSASQEICDNLLRLIRDRHADTVLLFHPIKNEPDLRSLVSILNREGICTAFPISVTEPVGLDFHVVADVNDMEVGTYGIREPDKYAPMPKISSRSVCVVPALAYDRYGFRLGYGKGFYDRFLADFDGVSVGITYDGFIADKLPRDRYDLCVDTIITERGVILPDEIDKSIICPEKT